MIIRVFQVICRLCIIYPFAWLWLGIRVKHKNKLPVNGPAIIVANHNSHIDIFILFCIFPLYLQKQLHPVAAEDYFSRNKWLSWIVRNTLNIIPISRNDTQENSLSLCEQALHEGKILLFFPEGTRGEPGKLSPLKPGIWYLTQKMPKVLVIPICIKGTEYVMAKGHYFPLPLFIDVNIGDTLMHNSNRKEFMYHLLERFLMLQKDKRIL